MSNAWARTYDYPASVTKSDTVDDPAGNFAGLLVTVAGNVTIYPVAGPLAAAGITIDVIAGQYIDFPVKRVGVTGTTATVLGLVSAIIKQGP